LGYRAAAGPQNAIQPFSVRTHGFFTELDIRTSVSVNPAVIRKLTVTIGDGDLDSAWRATPQRRAPAIAAHIAKGRISLPAAWNPDAVNLTTPPGTVIYRGE